MTQWQLNSQLDEAMKSLEKAIKAPKPNPVTIAKLIVKIDKLTAQLNHSELRG